MRPGQAVWWTSALSVAASALLGLVFAAVPARATHDNPDIAMVIDVDTTGNGPNSLGPHDSCLEASAGDTIQVDLAVIGVPPWVDGDIAPGLPSPDDHGGIAGFYYDFRFPVGFPVSGPPAAPDHRFIIGANEGSVLADTSDPVPDTFLPWAARVTDTSGSPPESGEGVLTRLTLDISLAMPAGLHHLDLETNFIVPANGEALGPLTAFGAVIAVDALCPTAPPVVTYTPTPLPTPTPKPTPTPTPEPMPTPFAGATEPPPFDPNAFICLDTFESGERCDGDFSAGGHPDLEIAVCLGFTDLCNRRVTPPSRVDDAAFDTVVSFLPGTVAVGETIPIGALAGKLRDDLTLGILSGPCVAGRSLEYNLMNGSTDVSALIAPLAAGEHPDLMLPFAADTDGNAIPDGADRYPTFLAALFDPDRDYGPDGVPFTPDDSAGPLPPVKPRVRLTGFAKVPRVSLHQAVWFAVQVLVFERGVTLRGPDGQPMTLDASLGYPTVTIFQDPINRSPDAVGDICAPTRARLTLFGLTRDNPCTPRLDAGIYANCPSDAAADPELRQVSPERGYPLFACEAGNNVDEDADAVANDGCPQVGSQAESGPECANDVGDDFEDSSINDGCPVVGEESEGGFVAGTCTGGSEASCRLVTSPAAEGLHDHTIFANSKHDADGDGIENALDICFDIPNGSWQPRGFDEGRDRDGDGLPNVCDPLPDKASPGSSQACIFGFIGPDDDQDCVANGQDDCPLVPDETQSDDDRDGIGDACDPQPAVPNGGYATVCLTFEIEYGEAGGATSDTPGENRDPNCARGQPVAPTPTPRATTPTPSATPTPHDGGTPTGAGSPPSPTPTSTALPAFLPPGGAGGADATNRRALAVGALGLTVVVVVVAVARRRSLR